MLRKEWNWPYWKSSLNANEVGFFLLLFFLFFVVVVFFL